MMRRLASRPRGAVLLASVFCTIGAMCLLAPVSPASAQARPDRGTPAKSQRAPEPEERLLSEKTIRYNEAKRAANEGVVSITASGRTTVYSQFAEDIRNVIESLPENNLRIVPILGKSAGQNLLDILYLRGIDMGIVDQDILQYFKQKDPEFYGDLEKRVNFIAKLFNTEFHLLAKKDIRTLEDLRGKPVSCLKEMSTVALLCENIFRLLKIEIQILFEDAELAMLRLKRGEIAAAVRAGTPPVPGLSAITAADDLHFVPVNEESLPGRDFNPIRAVYLPSRLKAEDYPNLVPAGESVPTVATSTLLAVYAWPPESKQYQEIGRFIDLFFSNVDKFRSAPRHPKWREVNLAADVPGWKRFAAAQEWLDHRRDPAGLAAVAALPTDGRLKAAFDKFLTDLSASQGGRGFTLEQRETLYAQFLQWWDTVGKQRR